MAELFNVNLAIAGLDSDLLLKSTVPLFKKLLRDQMRSPSLFIMTCDTSDDNREKVFQSLFSGLQNVIYKKQTLPLMLLELSLQQAGVRDWSMFPSSVVIRCLALDLSGSETMRDKLKEAVWQFRRPDAEYRADVGDFIAKQYPEIEKESFRRGRRLMLREFGLFVPSTTSKCLKQIRTHSFQHGAGHFYRYRVATERLAALENTCHGAARFLTDLFDECPNHLFKSGPRISAQRLLCDIPLVEVHDHELSNLALAAAAASRYKSAHENVEVYLLENDPSTIATEVPLWVEREELSSTSLSGCPLGHLTGHVDVLRCVGDTLEIWDYKPNASLERFAFGQVMLYALVMSIRTGVPLSRIVCGYFDEKVAYAVKAVELDIDADQAWISVRTD